MDNKESISEQSTAPKVTADVSQNVPMSGGETILRNYHYQHSEAKKMSIDSEITLTNKRVIFSQEISANQLTSKNKKTFPIKDIDTIKSAYNVRKPLKPICILLPIIGLAALILLTAGLGRFVVGFAIFLVTALISFLIWKFTKKQLMLHMLLNNLSFDDYDDHLSLGNSLSAVSATKKKRRKMSKRKARRLARKAKKREKAFKDMVNSGLDENVVITMVNEIGALVLNMKQEIK